VQVQTDVPSGKATIYIIPWTINLKPSNKAEHGKKQSEKELEHVFRQAKMAGAGAVSASMALFFLVTLCASQMVSSLRPGVGVGLGTSSASGYLLGRSGNCEKSNDPDCCEDGKK